MDWHKLLTKPFIVASCAVFCTMLWGSSFPLIKTGYDLLGISGSTGGIIYFASFRFLLAALIMFIAMKVSGMKLGLTQKKDWISLAIIALLQTAVQFTFFYIGLANTTGMKASIINGSGSFFTVILSHLFISDDRISFKKITGLILGFTGLVLVNFDKSLLDFSFKFTGEGFILLTSITGAIGSVLIKKVSGRISPVHITAYQFLLGAIILFIISISIEFPAPMSFKTDSLLILLYLSLVSAVSFTLWYLLIRHNNLSRIAIYFFMVPIWGTIFSALIVKSEFMTLMIYIALALVSFGIYLTNKE